MWLVVTVVAVVVLVATYLTWLAGRVDRLHARAAAAHSALDAQSVRRAAAAVDLAERCGFSDVQAAGKAVLESEPDAVLENDLTRALRARAAALPEGQLAAVAAASRRLALARQVHTDLTRDARQVRHHPAVRLFGFTRNVPEPAFFDIDDPTLRQGQSG